MHGQPAPVGHDPCHCFGILDLTCEDAAAEFVEGHAAEFDLLRFIQMLAADFFQVPRQINIRRFIAPGNGGQDMRQLCHPAGTIAGLLFQFAGRGYSRILTGGISCSSGQFQCLTVDGGAELADQKDPAVRQHRYCAGAAPFFVVDIVPGLFLPVRQYHGISVEFQNGAGACKFPSCPVEFMFHFFPPG